jgi:hypothetical protein
MLTTNMKRCLSIVKNYVKNRLLFTCLVTSLIIAILYVVFGIADPEPVKNTSNTTYQENYK